MKTISKNLTLNIDKECGYEKRSYNSTFLIILICNYNILKN